MPSINPKQQKFTLMIANLILYANMRGVGLTFGDAYATTGHIKNSNHYNRLAVDFNLFVDGEYIDDGDHPEFIALHNYWVSIGGCTIDRDRNHFSVEHNGVK